MTDEEKAKKYFEDSKDYYDSREPITDRKLRQIYLDGLAEGRQEKWHDLRWHKQSNDDIYDLISEDWSVKHFICIMKDKNLITAIGNCDEGFNGEVSVNLFFEHNDEKYYLDDIVLWKEITLPEEIEQ